MTSDGSGGGDRSTDAPPMSAGSERLFTLVLTQGPISRVAIARRTGLSAAAVTKIAKPLLAAGYLVETAERERTAPGAGRPANPLQVRAEREYFVGIKISQFHVRAVLTNLRAEVQASLTRNVVGRAPEDVVAQIATMVDWLRSGEPAFRELSRTIGVAVSGEVDRKRGIVDFSPFLDWRDVPLAAMVAEATDMAVIIENDVRALTVGEHWFGAGVGLADFAVVTLGQGIGAGAVSGDRLLSGAFGAAGELGHTPVAEVDAPCRCGASGCVEAIASSLVLTDEIRAVTGDLSLGFPNAVRLAKSGHAEARAIFLRAARSVGRATAVLANLLGPERIIVSADNADLASYDEFHAELEAAFRRQAFGILADCELVPVHRPLDAWARAAAIVAIQALLIRQD